ncbi:MAG: hypothetical protein ABSF29_15070 [Tepidisphaeraceae bacterium]|jgi:hypothetical protein
MTAPQLPNTSPPLPLQTLPYYTPIPTSTQGAWRTGKTLIIAQNAVLPDCCVKCNLPTGGARYRHNITWYPWYLLLMFLYPRFGLIVLLILYLVLKKTFPLNIAVCPRHRRQRRVRIAAAFVTMLAGIYVLIFGVAHFRTPIALVGTLLIAAAFLIAATARILRPIKIDKTRGYFRGASPEFLDTLPGLATLPD